MSLKIWLPMNRDLRNQGLLNNTITNSGATYSSDGKLGGCYAFDGVNDSLMVGNLSTMVDTDFSFACWFYKDEWGTKRYETIFGGSSGFELESKVSSTNSPVLKLYNWGGGSCTYELSKWNHVVFTRNTTETKLYLNGELKATGTAGTIPNHDYFVGSWNTASQQNFKGKMCDVRIYDHCLSEMEIKQLSQGLVLHYPLNRQGFGQENLLSGNNAKITTWTNYMPNSVILSGDGYDNKYTLIKGIGGWEKIFTDAITVTSGKTYTLSFDYSVEQNYTGYNGQFGLSVCTTSQAKYGADTDIITKVNFGIVKKSKSRTSVTFVATSNSIYLVANGGNIYDDQENISFYISYIKLEEGSIATPWCPNSSDVLATTMGLNGMVEYDTSGYCNNGTKNNITYVSDTPKYEVSSVFNGTNSWIKVNENNWAVQGMKEMTVSFWAYSSDWTTRPKLISCTESGGWNLENGNTGYLRFPIHVYTNADQTSTAYKYSSNEIKVSDLEAGWHMITLIYDNTGNKVYIDGQPHSSYAFTSYGIHYNLNARLFLGCEANTASPYTPYLNGRLSDFRLYATALSADDVLSLYQNCATIDSDGTIRGQIRS